MPRPPEPEFAWFRLQWREITALAVLVLLVAGAFAHSALTKPGVELLEVQRQELPAARVNVNTATVAELTALPGIGERKAERVIEARGLRRIESIDDLAAAAGGIPARDRERLADIVSFE